MLIDLSRMASRQRDANYESHRENPGIIRLITKAMLRVGFSALLWPLAARSQAGQETAPCIVAARSDSGFTTTGSLTTNGFEHHVAANFSTKPALAISIGPVLPPRARTMRERVVMVARDTMFRLLLP